MPVVSPFPTPGVGDLVTADYLAAFIPATVTKAALTSRTSTVTLTADPDLQGITLGVGTWKIDLSLFWSLTSSATQKIVTQWGFTGTWNNPIRNCFGAGSTNTLSRDDAATVNTGGYATNASCTYDVLNAVAFAASREITYTAVVTVAGDLSLQWAQAASSVNPTIVQVGSSFEIRQIG